MRYVPLLVVPLLLYDVFAFLIFANYEDDFREAVLLHLPIVSGASFALTVSAAIIILAILLFGVEVVKATRVGTASVIDHMLATLLFIAYLLEFLLLPQAATSTFLILTVVALVDLLCGFAVSLKSATRDITLSG
jgi:hypothetical protein